MMNSFASTSAAILSKVHLWAKVGVNRSVTRTCGVFPQVDASSRG